MKNEDADREKVKRLLLGKPPLPVNLCSLLPFPHQGFIVPMVTMPQIIEGPELAAKGEMEKENMKIQIFVTLTAHCVRCGQVFNFGPPIPKPEGAQPPAEPGQPG